MARIDMDFPLGDCIFEGVSDGELCCTPWIPPGASGNLWYTFLCRLTDADRPVNICLRWPNTDPQGRSEYARNDNFATVLDRCLFVSRDLRRYRRIEGVRLEAQTAHFSIVPQVEPLYVTVGMPYLPHSLNELLADIADQPGVVIQEIGLSSHGRPVQAITVTGGQDGTFFFQAMQHRSEWAGTRCIAEMIRYLLTEGQHLRQRFTWRFVPVVNMDGFYGGWPEDPPINLNRDWGTFTHPETRAVRELLCGLAQRGERLLYTSDMHMGWSERTSSGACLTVFAEDNVPPADNERLASISQHIFAHTDFTDRIWSPMVIKNRDTFAVWSYRTFAVAAQTMEFSRHLYRLRATGEWVPATQEHEEALGRDLAEALASYPW